MRKHTLYLLLAGWGLLAASCYDDKSTLQTTHIPPVEIEVPEAIASQLTVVHNARLDITGIPTCTRSWNSRYSVSWTRCPHAAAKCFSSAGSRG